MTSSHRDTETIDTAVTAILRQVLARLDEAHTHPEAAIHIQWAIDLLQGDSASAPPPTDPR